jgi:hypothetical protein
MSFSRRTQYWLLLFERKGFVIQSTKHHLLFHIIRASSITLLHQEHQPDPTSTTNNQK